MSNIKTAESDEIRDAVLSAIMRRYKGLCPLIQQLSDDADTAYVNLDDDLSKRGISISEGELEDIVLQIIG